MRFFWAEKILPRFFRLREIHKKPKKLKFYTAGFLFSMRFFWAEKILPRFFRLREIHKKPKKLKFFAIFGSHTNKWGL
jgi:predicted nucleotidyltransferase component of viral defense system